MEHLSALIIRTVESNNNFIEKWYSRLLYSITEEFIETQVLPPTTLNIVVPDTRPNVMKYVTFHNFGYTDYDFANILRLNYLHGAPLFVVSFSGMVKITITDIIGQETIEEILFMTLETPLKKERQIFAIAIDDDGKKSFRLDEEKSRYLTLPKEVNRFNNIIQPGINMN